MLNWKHVCEAAKKALEIKQLTDDIYQLRLDYELAEIDRQGSNAYWLGLINSNSKFTPQGNPNNLLLPYLLGMVDIDPIASRDKSSIPVSSHYDYISELKNRVGSIPHDIRRDADMPDIDIDCLPDAREHIRKYAEEQYGADCVCSVGTWQTYLFKSALIDSAMALSETLNPNGSTKSVVFELTTSLPEDADALKDNGESACKGRIRDAVTMEERDCGFKHAGVKCPKCGCSETEDPTIGQLLADYKQLALFNEQYPNVVQSALRLIGKIRHVGKHAGALIIADRPLYGNVPMYKRAGDTAWVSMWTEGRSTQLSKLGYTKWDVLGLKNLTYIYEVCKLISENHGLDFGEALSGLEYTNPEENTAGVYWVDGERKIIPLDDPGVFALANAQKTDTIFQFDTNLAKQILGHGVKNFSDLMLLNAMGHPGPMQCIPEAVANRDDPTEIWKSKLHKDILPILESTYGVICYQEQLQAMWQRVAGFTAPEAQAARKAVAKKWRDQLKPIEKKWVDGASPLLGRTEAEQWWQKQTTFGRYAFNKCLSEDTILEDITTGIKKTIRDWRGSKLSLLSEVDGILVKDECVDIHYNGPQMVYKILFDDDSSEIVTMQHQFKCTDNSYHSVEEIIENSLNIIVARV